MDDHAQGCLSDLTSKPTDSQSAMTVNELLLVFIRKEIPRYSESERHAQAAAIRVLQEFFGETPISEFGPLRLRQVRDSMVAGDPKATNAQGKPAPRKLWSRKTVNRQVKRLQAIFRWGVSFELVPESVPIALSNS